MDISKRSTSLNWEARRNAAMWSVEPKQSSLSQQMRDLSQQLMDTNERLGKFLLQKSYRDLKGKNCEFKIIQLGSALQCSDMKIINQAVVLGNHRAS